jgi:hypothetical protein
MIGSAASYLGLRTFNQTRLIMKSDIAERLTEDFERGLMSRRQLAAHFNASRGIPARVNSVSSIYSSRLTLGTLGFSSETELTGIHSRLAQQNEPTPIFPTDWRNKMN